MAQKNPLARAGGLMRSAQNALERRVQNNHQEMALQPSKTLASTVMMTLVGVTLFGIGWLAIAKTDEVVIAPGKLQPIGDVKTIQVPLGGVLQTMLVKEGQRVQQGQVLLRLDNEASLDQQKSLQQSIAAKRQQLVLKDIELARYQSLNDTEQQVLRQNLVLEKEILTRLETLRRQGASAELQVLQQRNKVRDVDGELSKTRADRLRQIAILAQSVEQLRGELADLQSKLTESRVNIRYRDIRSPVDGVVFDLKPTGPGFVAQGSEPVMKIVPYNNMVAKVEIPSDQIGFVRVGKPVDISIDSFPASDFGVIQGTLTSIGSDALAPDQLHQTYRFPAEVRLSTQNLTLHSGQQLPLQVGMSLTANIKLRKVSYLQLLLSDFKDKTDSLKRI
jgi:HlyD family secretion protein